MIILNKVSKAFNSRKVLDSISLKLSSGKTHVLLGESGSGKSTLLRIIAGLIQPDAGKIILGSHFMNSSNHSLLAKKIGYVIQDGGLFPHLTALDNVTLVSKTLGWCAQQIRKRIKELIELTGLDESILHRYPKELSGGQRQRVGIMRACFLSPEIMLMDEPLGAVDPITRKSLQTELRKIFKLLRQTVVVVTHDIGEAAYLGDTVTLLAGGEVVQHGTFTELVRNPSSAFVTQFIESQQSFSHLKGLL